MIFDNKLVYDQGFSFDYSNLNPEKKWVLESIGDIERKEILEVGCHTGNLTAWLHQRGAMVTGADINADALDVAKDYCIKTVAGDIEDASIQRDLFHTKFDYILAMHVLEHLVNPWDVLSKLVDNLKNDGEILIALPNISNMKNRLDFFLGEFEYEETGVMDKTHLRFFNQKTARELIHSAGLKVVSYDSKWQVVPSFLIAQRLFPVRTKRIGKWLTERFFHFSANETDVVMLFRCKKDI